MILMFFFSVSFVIAASSKLGATITSVNTSESASAKDKGTSRLTATIPPNADMGSHAFARMYASVMSSWVARPQGFACLMTATVGSPPIECTSRQAASVSNKFR